jgi:hypothetical protein
MACNLHSCAFSVPLVYMWCPLLPCCPFAAATARALMQNPMFNLTRELVLPQPKSGCYPLTNKAAIAGKVAVVSIGECL